MEELIGRVDGFCIASSDRDFTRLATRVREAGLIAYGFGQRHPPAPFVAACDKFVCTELPKSPWARSAQKLRLAAPAFSFSCTTLAPAIVTPSMKSSCV